MGSYIPGRYRLPADELIALIARVQNDLLMEHPGLKPFRSEIGSYIARVVEGRNERGIARAESFRKDKQTRAKYHEELISLAEEEAQNCEARFRDRAQALAQKNASDDGDNDSDNDSDNTSTSAIKDFDIMPIHW